MIYGWHEFIAIIVATAAPIVAAYTVYRAFLRRDLKRREALLEKLTAQEEVAPTKSWILTMRIFDLRSEVCLKDSARQLDVKSLKLQSKPNLIALNLRRKVFFRGRPKKGGVLRFNRL